MLEIFSSIMLEIFSSIMLDIFSSIMLEIFSSIMLEIFIIFSVFSTVVSLVRFLNYCSIKIEEIESFTYLIF